jgi:hypothetical protein
MTYYSSLAAVSGIDASESTSIERVKFLKIVLYSGICIQGVAGSHDALHDSGLQVNLVKRELLQHLPLNYTNNRTYKYQGIIGPAIETDLALLDIKPAPKEVSCVNIASPLWEMFAVCDELNETVILTADTKDDYLH